ncbi:DUF6328 family protein [Thermomonospora umbrina]|uniref:Uncharacterized protein n=1 Tax=Thermomonospora umbrina TaxID=111806 RepID=A0A3D9SFX8_9ACTN|nr:DUF6328 family protein [Thermomonospora umbrina]REE94812.1 hypothetical protein DFJ69_0177 [Thermomonospora umbrina]
MTSESHPHRTGGGPETPAERADRNFVELLQGFRVAVTGVQVLFAFLLTVPFSPGFARVAEGDRRLFYVSLLGAAVASLFFIAPVAQHRVLFRQGLKEPLVHRSNVYGMVGTLSLGVSMTAATLLVVDYLFDGLLPMITAGIIAVLATWLWFAEPLLRRMNGGDHD